MYIYCLITGVVHNVHLQCDYWCCILSYHDASFVHASGIGQLQTNPSVVGPSLSPGMSTRRAVTTMGRNDFVIGEDHLLGSSCRQYNWHMNR